MSRLKILDNIMTADLFWGLTPEDYHSPADMYSRFNKNKDPRENNDDKPRVYRVTRREFGELKVENVEFYRGDLLSRAPYGTKSS